MKIFNYLLAAIFAIGLLGVFVFVALLILDSSDSIWAKFAFILVLGSGVYLAVWLFRIGSRHGIFSLTVEGRTTHELDEVMHQNDPNVHHGSVQEWITMLERNELGFAGGFLSIWRYDRGHELDEFHELREYRLSSSGKLMLSFTDGTRLHIEGIDKMYFAETFIKVMKANKIDWMYEHGKKKITFNYINNCVSAVSNFDWKPGSTDLIAAGPAIFIWRSL